MAQDFNGTTTSLEASTAVVTSTPCTIAAWCNPDAIHSGYVLIVGHTSDVGRLGLFVANSGELSALQKEGGSVDQAVATSAYVSGVWQHAAGIFTSNALRAAYLNGGNKGTNTTSIATSSLDRTRVGSRPPDAYFFDGKIAEAAVWNAALDDDEIALLAAGFSPLALERRLGNLVLYQDFIRYPNRPGVGPPMSVAGTLGTTEHVRLVRPGIARNQSYRPDLLEPYALALGQSESSTAEIGQLTLTGAVEGSTYPFGEVIG